MVMQDDVIIPAELLQIFCQANRVVVLTGAGVSAESGVPTFRDAMTGLWAKYDPAELATPAAFQRDPKLVWQWYCWRRDTVLRVRPNSAHQALVSLNHFLPEFTLITQNVDGLHSAAGSQHVIELHGNIRRAKCFANNHLAESWPDNSDQLPPRCEICDSPMRPDVVWFDEELPVDALAAAIDAAEQCDLFLSVGTSSLVYPAAALALTAANNGATVTEINPNPTPLTSRADYYLAGPAGVILPKIVRALSDSQIGHLSRRTPNGTAK
jgi:NAD-dependent deacetylase